MPVYNVEGYLRQCLDSFANQTLREIEVICVDDGSTDGSAAILAEYAARDARVKVLARAHANAGAARNAGLAVATGDWLFFSDADDFAGAEMLARMTTADEAADADVVVAGHRTLEGGRYSVGRLPRRLVGGHAAEGGAWPPWLFVDAGVMPWNKLFRRSFVQRHAFAFQEVVRHNDMRFVCCALAAAGKIAVSDTCGYVYRRGRRGSVTGNQDVSPSLFADVLSALRTELDRRGLLAKSMRAYCNLALAHCCYHLLGEFEPGRFAELFAALHGHVLAELGLAAADGDVFINRKHDGYRAAILADETPLSLWMLLLRERYADWRELGARADRIATLQARVREAETQRGELAGKVAAAERRVDELERQRAEAVRAQAELARTLQAVRASASYRIGRLVTSPFRALRKPGNA